MRFTNLRLQNFKPFEDISVSFDAGVSVIHGPNGAGKSSFIEGAFFALYGVDGLTSEETLDEIVTNEKDECIAEAEFVVGNETYTVTRKIVVGANGDASTDSCVLEWSDGVVSGVRNTREKIEELLNMSAESYLNCAYVRQGEITRLINATPEERKSMIDDLLNLGILEVYKERGSNARVGVKRARRDIDGEITTLENSIDERNVSGLKQRVSAIADEISRYETRVAVLKQYLETLDDVRDEIVSQINSDAVERQSELEDTKHEVERKIESKRQEIRDIESTLSDLRTERSEHRDQIRNSGITDEVDAISGDEWESIDAVHESSTELVENIETELADTRDKKESVVDERDAIADEISTLENEKATINTKVETASDRVDTKTDERNELVQKYNNVQSQIDSVVSEMPSDIDADDTLSEFDTEVTELLDSLESTTADERDMAEDYGRLRMLKRLFEDGDEDIDIRVADTSITSFDELVKTLTDVQDKLSHLESERDDTLDTISDRISALVSLAEYKKHETRINELEQKRDEYISSLHGVERDLRNTHARVDSLTNEREAKEQELQEKERQLGEKDGTIRGLEETIDSLESRTEKAKLIQSRAESVSQLTDRIEQYEQQKTQLTDAVDELEERLDDVTTELDEIETPEKEHDELVDERDELDASMSAVESTISSFESHVQSLHSEHGEVVQSIREYERETNRLAELREKKRLLDSVYSEAEELEALYGSLRSDLRESHVEQLETLMNEIFSDIYQTKSYQRVEISNEYDINIVEKSGSTMKPHMLSGGEKVVFNMSLRCAIYKLIAESGGDSPHDSLPPLILDEPTAHLDDEHVSQLTRVVSLMRDMGVSQTLIISHQQEIVDDADVEYVVSSNPTTNRSSITRDTATDIQL